MFYVIVMRSQETNDFFGLRRMYVETRGELKTTI